MDELLRRKGPADGGARLDEDMTASDPLLDQPEDAAGSARVPGQPKLA
jgi:hypothetical protein